jgi:hypothetical protein
MRLNDSLRRVMRVGALLLLVVATAASLRSLAGTAQASCNLGYGFVDVWSDPSTHSECGWYSSCPNGPKYGCKGAPYTRVTTSGVNCCSGGGGL